MQLSIVQDSAYPVVIFMSRYFDVKPAQEAAVEYEAYVAADSVNSYSKNRNLFYPIMMALPFFFDPARFKRLTGFWSLTSFSAVDAVIDSSADALFSWTSDDDDNFPGNACPETIKLIMKSHLAVKLAQLVDRGDIVELVSPVANCPWIQDR